MLPCVSSVAPVVNSRDITDGLLARLGAVEKTVIRNERMTQSVYGIRC